jgi:hypothetical protein
METLLQSSKHISIRMTQSVLPISLSSSIITCTEGYEYCSGWRVITAEEPCHRKVTSHTLPLRPLLGNGSNTSQLWSDRVLWRLRRGVILKTTGATQADSEQFFDVTKWMPDAPKRRIQEVCLWRCIVWIRRLVWLSCDKYVQTMGEWRH